MSLGPDGVPRSIVVDQRLTIHGLGDFFFKVSGPAMDVEATAESEAEPGLRKGSVLWQGFSEGKKVLAARMPLFVEQELARLPLRTKLRLKVDGEPLELGERASGDFELTFTVDNVSESLTSFTVANGNPGELARSLDAVARVLDAGDRPVPGESRVPEEVTLGSNAETMTRRIEMPFDINGRFVFPANSELEVEGGGELSQNVVNFHHILGGGAASRIRVQVAGRATDLGYPRLHMKAAPVPPIGSLQLRPPAGESWRGAVAQKAVSGREMFEVLMRTMWQVAKLRTFDAYLGNPDPTGPATSTYRYRMAKPEPIVRAPAVSVTEVSPWTTALAVVALLLLLFALAVWWSLS